MPQGRWRVWKDRGWKEVIRRTLPLLKLSEGMPLMLVSNDDAANGHANGTRV